MQQIAQSGTLPELPSRSPRSTCWLTPETKSFWPFPSRKRSMPLCRRKLPPVSTTMASVGAAETSSAGGVANQTRPASHSEQIATPTSPSPRKTPHICTGPSFSGDCSSTVELAAQHRTEQRPPLAVKPRHLDLLDRRKIGRAGVDLDPGEQHWHGEVVQVGCLFHYVLPGQVIAALLQHLHQSLTEGGTDNIAGI